MYKKVIMVGALFFSTILSGVSSAQGVSVPSIPQVNLSTNAAEKISAENVQNISNLNIAEAATPKESTKSALQERQLRTSTVQATYNDNPNNALTIGTGQVYYDYITVEGGEKWYTFQTTTAGKLTSILQTVQSASVDYDLHLYRLDLDTYQLVEEYASAYGPQMNEQLSRIAPAGIYYLAVNSYAGSDDTNPFYFEVLESPTYDSAEPDDNYAYANVKTGAFQVSQTIDNDFDQDWIKYTVSANKQFTISFTNPAAGTTYQVGIYNQNLSLLGTIAQNTSTDFNISAGTYYFRVISLSSSNASQPYTLSIGNKATQVTVNNVASDPGVSGKVNYGYGSKYRIKNYITVSGVAKDSTGAAAAYVPITVVIQTTINNKVYSAATTTDANGAFTASINNIQPASGFYSYNNWVSIHYFDIIPLQINSNSTLSSNETSLYHFAYSIYNPH